MLAVRALKARYLVLCEFRHYLGQKPSCIASTIEYRLLSLAMPPTNLPTNPICTCLTVCFRDRPNNRLSSTAWSGGPSQPLSLLTTVYLRVAIKRSTKTLILGFLSSVPLAISFWACTVATASRIIFSRRLVAAVRRVFPEPNFLPRAFILPRASPAFFLDSEIALTAA